LLVFTNDSSLQIPNPLKKHAREQCHRSKITAYTEERREEEGEKRTGSWSQRRAAAHGHGGGRQLTGVEGLGEEEESMGQERAQSDRWGTGKRDGGGESYRHGWREKGR
jgi:hypothetical protein